MDPVERRVLLGLESEYALHQSASDGEPIPRAGTAQHLLLTIPKVLAGIRDMTAPGFFLSNGSRLYMDAGHHFELASPECPSPAEVVRYVRAGEALLERLVEGCDVDVLGCRTSFYRTNVDLLRGTTWGTHESYLYRRRDRALAEELIPHLVSRVLYSGAGGFDARSFGLAFTLSPRVSFLERTLSRESTEARGIFHTKSEALSSRGFHRLHLVLGESLCSELASYLKLGTTALVVRLIDLGLCTGQQMALRQPLQAIRRFALASEAHTGPKAPRAMLRTGRRVTALAIQRHYLALAEAHLEVLPDWAETLCAHWRVMLDRLERGDGLATRLDWAIKRALYLRVAAREGFDADRWQRMNDAFARASKQTRLREDTVAVARAHPHTRATRPLRSELRAIGVPDDESDAFEALRQRLLELDWRFGEIGRHGVFEQMRGEGLLDEALPGMGSVDDATSVPPFGSRAWLRGHTIRRLSRKPFRYGATWEGIHDREMDRSFTFSDPFATSASWQPAPEPFGSPFTGIGASLVDDLPF